MTLYALFSAEQYSFTCQNVVLDIGGRGNLHPCLPSGSPFLQSYLIDLHRQSVVDVHTDEMTINTAIA